MAIDIGVCFTDHFESHLRKFYSVAEVREFKEYVRQKISKVVEKINCVGNGIRLTEVHLDLGQKDVEIEIDLDSASPNYETAYLQVGPEMVEPLVDGEKRGVIGQVEFREEHCNRTGLSPQNLIHEFGHLQDTQREGFGYTRECEDLHDYIKVIWNVLLEGRLYRMYGVAARSKEDNWECYCRALNNLGVNPEKKEFKRLWEKKEYCYQEIKDLAQSYSDISKSND